jgi:hypothetical protein
MDEVIIGLIWFAVLITLVICFGILGLGIIDVLEGHP